jgi:transposase
MAGYGKRYTQEFKDSAIQLALNSKKSAMTIAKELGMSNKTLYGWLREYRRQHNLDTSSTAYRISKSTTSESLEEENKRLRKELVNIKKEREILKKAAAYFAKETL